MSRTGLVGSAGESYDSGSIGEAAGRRRDPGIGKMSAGTLVGRRLGGYEVTSLLGEGGMGEVYLARHIERGRTVALKVLGPHLARSETFRRRFLSESRLAARLDHPNVVPIYEAGSDDDVLFIAMRYVEGRDLGAILRAEGPLELKRVVHIVRQVASALDAAHQLGLVHRDVKPANVLVTSDGHAYLTDFGLMKSSEGQSRYTETGQIVGTVDYLSPEQIRGEEIDRRVDVYALGCLIYECLAGSPPYARDSDVAVLWAHVNDDIPSVTARRPLRPAFENVVRGALAKDPVDRFATCGDLADALAAAVDGGPVLIPRASSVETTKGRRWRTRTLARGFTRVVSASLAVGVIAFAAQALTDDARVVDSTSAGPSRLGKQQHREAIAHDRQRPKAQRRDMSGARNEEGPGPNARPANQALELEGHDTSAAAAPGRDNASPVRSTRAAPGVVREVTGTYTSQAIGGISDCRRRDDLGCLFFESKNSERSIGIEIRDSAGVAVAAYVRQDIDGDGAWDGSWQEICRQTDEAIDIMPGAVVNVVVTGTCSGGGRATSGTVYAIFSS